MLLFFAGVPTAAMRSVADFMLAGRVTDLQALEPWYLSLIAHNFRILIASQPFSCNQHFCNCRYTAHSRSIFDDLSLGGSLLPSKTKCCVRHPGSQCLHNLPAFFLRSLPPALSVYAPVHMLAMLTRLPKIDLKTFITDSLRSAIFLATFCSQPYFMNSKLIVNRY
jgi:hypothetical protein